ncbi:DUF2889 domain-containing protein [Acidocella sp.]|uniref:DUF2889 domain-containing protein n=1 Tax=Acidocella sp. TaxID=50710 RepID=UPI0026312292|nr:DUF2889 domain-containing protein [Acidocella sp.]
MPLPRPHRRKLLHTRHVELRGYEREDGLIDIEARLTDEKTYAFGNEDRGGINPGDYVHDMSVRLTITPDQEIVEALASMDATPYAICPGVAPNMARLVGLRLGKGFLKSAMMRLPGPEGCTHLRELLQPLATAAFQTTVGLKTGFDNKTAIEEPALTHSLLNSCHAYDEQGPVIARRRAPAAE